MGTLASFAMGGRLQAALVAATAGLLSLLLPPLFIVSAAPVALWTLRRGGWDGALVVLLATLVILIITVVFRLAPLAASVLVVLWLPVWVLAATLRATVSLAMTLRLAVLMGTLGVLVFYLAVGDPAAWWPAVMDGIREELQAQGLQGSEADLDGFLSALGDWGFLIPGLWVAILLLYGLLGLLLGRWWQAVLFNPGGFHAEFQELRLGKGLALVAAPIVGLGMTMGPPLVMNLALALGVVYVLQGIALVHAVAAKIRLAVGWLVAFYVVLVLALPLMGTLLCWLGIIDPWLDIRARVRSPTGTR